MEITITPAAVQPELQNLDRRNEKNCCEIQPAVVVRNAWKMYSTGFRENETVLRGLDMTVPCGALYCLLGSSGCGKTSLLSCIVGIQNLSSGNVSVFGNQPGTNDVGIPGKNVGYMPQDISLYGEFSISETFRYFGTLSGLSDEAVYQKSKFLRKLLELSNLMRRINTLSGGTQRRVSFAASLIHNTKLLILDEPTVGVDALLRQKIWTYLQKLASNEGTTIIISTHYLDEARQADLVGIIRGGKMIAETSPTQLINSQGAGSLQSDVLNLFRQSSNDPVSNSQNDASEQRNLDELEVRTKNKINSIKSVPPSKIKLLKESVRRIKTLVEKNFAIIFRNLLLLTLLRDLDTCH